MTKEKPIPLLADLNKIVKGCSSVKESIDSNSAINEKKAIRACCVALVSLSNTLKSIICDLTENDVGGGTGANEDFLDMFNNIVNKK